MTENTQSTKQNTISLQERKTKLLPIQELLGKKFFIPSYQRGYRWTDQQVKALLDDINDFEPQRKSDGELTWYCLQPLAVSPMSDKDQRLDKQNDKTGWYEVIDGQQRLTTIYIILKIFDSIGENYPQIVYETRQGSGEFLKYIEAKTIAVNIDYHFMLCARETVREWKKKLTDQHTTVR